MGWSTEIIVVRNYADKKNGELTWKAFNKKSIEIIEWNKIYLAQYMYEVIDDFPGLYSEIRDKTDDPKYDDGDGYHYCGWYYCQLTQEILEELSKPEAIEKFADMYQDHSGRLEKKKDRKEFIKEWKEALRVCRYLVNKFGTNIYWVQG